MISSCLLTLIILRINVFIASKKSHKMKLLESPPLVLTCWIILRCITRINSFVIISIMVYIIYITITHYIYNNNDKNRTDSGELKIALSDWRF